MPESGIALTARLRVLPQYVYPQRTFSALVRALTRVRTPWFKNALIRIFCRAFQVDMSEAADSDAGHYSDFNAFFTRALRPGARPLDPDPAALPSPVDGTVCEAGQIGTDRRIHAKGHDFDITELLGGDEVLAEPFRGGAFTTLYLSPRDYHRIHMPMEGTLRTMVHVPGRLFSVSLVTARGIPRLFARNERIAALFDTPIGPLGMVLVGAINVSSIATVWGGTITPPYAGSVRKWQYPAEGAESIRLDRGAEMGRFNMGSTVIVLLPPETVELDSGLVPGSPVRLGRSLGRIVGG